ncbi:MAG TPA: peptidase E [Propionibacteriaceae bacterium]|nr:peptidase E [Propionibacteriaceae bacterium]
MTTHIVAMGGGGFSMSGNGAPTSIDNYLLELSGKSSPLVAFAPTASADDPTYINRFLTAYGTLGVRTMILTLWQGAQASVERLADADVVLVGGGSTVNLMALWDAHGVSRAVKQRATRGDVVLAGLSAGAACWFEGCVTDSFGDFRPWRGGTGLLPGSFCPHFNSEGGRAPVFTSAVASGVLPGGYGVDDGAALVFADGRLVRGIAERDGLEALRFDPSNEPTSSGILTEHVPLESL